MKLEELSTEELAQVYGGMYVDDDAAPAAACEYEVQPAAF